MKRFLMTMPVAWPAAPFVVLALWLLGYQLYVAGLITAGALVVGELLFGKRRRARQRRRDGE